MPGWLKVLLAIVVVIALLAATGVVLAYRWFSNNKERLMAEGKQVAAEGKAFGEGKQADDCIAESLARVKKCNGFACEVRVRLFLDACVSASDAKAFCATAPAPTEFVRSAKWSLEECARRGMPGDQRCTRLLQGAQAACERREASR
jgi:hypothetical protein